jgi:hypothetical protein
MAKSKRLIILHPISRAKMAADTGHAAGASARDRGSFRPLIRERSVMDNISGAWLYPIILIAGALQAWGPPINGALRNAMTNPWLASIVSFIPVIALLAVLWLCQPRPMPTIEGISNMPWWAPLGGVVGAFGVNDRFQPGASLAGAAHRIQELQELGFVAYARKLA